MAKNVMKMLKPSPTLGRNAFDMSHRTIFSANAGELLPAFCLETVPNDKITFKASDLLRAAPMITSPFLRAKQHIDYWFVPYQALWSRWNDFITSRSEPNSAAFADYQYLPHIAMKDLLDALYNEYTVTQSFTKDVVGLDILKGQCRLLDMLGYDSSSLAVYAFDHTKSYSSSSAPDVSVNLFRLAAYNYIWYKEYRQKYYDDGRYALTANALNVANLFNFDLLPCSSSVDSDLTYFSGSYSGLVSAMTQMRYRTWKKDLFTGLMPSTQFGNVSTVSSSGDLLQKTVTAAPYTFIGPSNNLVGSNLTWRDSSNAASGNPVAAYVNPSFDILSLRRSEAIQKWRENALRAGNQIEDNYEAHYGSKPHSHMISHPTYIGSFDAPLNISDVNSTAQTGQSQNGALGDIAGKGISTMDDKSFTFQTNDFGVIIGMWSLLPEAEYESTGIHRNNQLLEQFDFFMPEFENLGLEAVSTQNWLAFNQSTYPTIPKIMGYAPRYYGYKTEFDKVHYGFWTSQPYHHWATPKSDVLGYLLSNMFGSVPMPLSLLYVNPTMLDTVFVSSAANEQQFIVDLFNDVTALRSMSVSGMPGY